MAECLSEGHNDANDRDPLSRRTFAALEEKAQGAGLDRDTYIRAVLSKDVASEPAMSEILASFRDQVADSRIANEELERLFSEAREESYRERNSSKN